MYLSGNGLACGEIPAVSGWMLVWQCFVVYVSLKLVSVFFLTVCVFESCFRSPAVSLVSDFFHRWMHPFLHEFVAELGKHDNSMYSLS